MNRLTQRIGVNGVAILASDMEEKFTAEELIDILLARLADYEDTGYEPCEIRPIDAMVKDLQEKAEPLIRAKNEGRLVEHPCKDGDPVWIIDWCSKKYKGYRCSCDCSCGQRERVFSKDCIPYCSIYRTEYRKYHLNQMGDTVFLTKKAAQKRLEEMANARHNADE